MDIETLKHLQKRIRESKGTDRELDAAICAAFRFAPIPKFLGYDDTKERWIFKFPDTFIHEIEDDDLDRHTASLDACVALLNAKFRIVRVEMDEAPSGCGARVVVWGNGLSEPATSDVKESHVSMALALLCCIVSAAIAEGEAKEKVA